jgi:(E)-4-hydroxy-3-methylbut-2-enyl-diphosphate synthase
MLYVKNIFKYQRRKTNLVQVGTLTIGSDAPIRVQSMTTTDTMDTEGSIAQSIRMIEAGCELVRLTAPSKKEAENLAHIQAGIRQQGYDTPLVADIHFTPNAAEAAAKIIDKVRINPGNYVDKKKFEEIAYTADTYQEELLRIAERFTPLVLLCKSRGVAMRIGTNHGSLSDRIMSYYGDTPQGMVESAMEFLRICQKNDYHNVVISMKSSNPLVMVQAYRLLVVAMDKENMHYPLHLGVTEAGDGEDGRIKSAVGIGALLEDGIGDTIRVSLTEDPEKEIPVAQKLVARYENPKAISIADFQGELPYNPYEYKRRETFAVQNVGAKHVPVVMANLSHYPNKMTPANFFPLGYHYSVPTDKWNLAEQACDYVYLGDNEIHFEIPGSLGILQNAETWLKNNHKDRHYPIFNLQNVHSLAEKSDVLNFLFIQGQELEQNLDLFKSLKNFVLILQAEQSMFEQRRAYITLLLQNLKIPVVLHRTYANMEDVETFQLHASTDLGALLLDGFGDGVMLEAPKIPQQVQNSTLFGILQATRTRISKTEYIACPSCGRTLFDLQETTAKIRAKTSHLKGLKIGIMGCIVNGPGEMADADYGYVGTGNGVITLYKQKTVVQKNVPEAEAVQALINLIKQHGDWIEPKIS